MNGLTVGVEQLDSITADIWATYVAAESVVMAFGAQDADPARTDISAQVDIHGEITGTVVVACDSGSAADLARRMFGLEPPEEPTMIEVADALGELANVVGGNVKALASHPGELTLPLVHAHERIVGWPRSRPSCGVEVVWDGGRATLFVWAGGDGAGGATSKGSL